MSIEFIGTMAAHSSQGGLSKDWYSVNKIPFMCKGNSYNEGVCWEPYSERMAYLIARRLGLPHAYTELANASDFPSIKVFAPCKHVSLCADLQKPDNVIVNLGDYVDAVYPNSKDMWKLSLDLLGEDYLYKLISFDAFIGNEDRHFNNISLYVDSYGNVSPTPLYDSGASLLAWESNLSSKSLRTDKSKPFRTTHKVQTKLLKHSAFNIRNPESILEKMLSDIDPVLSLLPPKRALAVQMYLKGRVHYLT